MNIKKHLIILILTFCLVLSDSIISAQSRSHIDFRFKSLNIDNQKPRKGDLVTFTIISEKKGSGAVDKVHLICKLRHFQVVDQELDFKAVDTVTTHYSWNTLPGSQVFKCVIDSNNTYIETDETNNESKIEFEVALPKLPQIPYKDFILLPDYSASIIHHPGLPGQRRFLFLPDLVPVKITLDEKNNTANIYINNRGGSFSANWEYKLSWGIDTPDKEDCSGTKTGIIKTYANFQITCQLPQDFFSRYNNQDIQFKFILDPKDIVKETDEINNLYYETINVKQSARKIIVE